MTNNTFTILLAIVALIILLSGYFYVAGDDFPATGIVPVRDGELMEINNAG